MIAKIPFTLFSIISLFCFMHENVMATQIYLYIIPQDKIFNVFGLLEKRKFNSERNA